MIVLNIVIRWDRQIPTFIIHKEILIASCFALGSLQMLKYIMPPDSRIMRITVKIALGLSIGGMFVWIFTVPTLFLVQITFLFIFTSAIALLASYRYNYVRRTCSGCVYHGDWDLCYGFRTLNHHCRLRPKMSKQAIRSMIFDRTRKRRWDKEDRAIPSCYHRSEPFLEDRPPWLYHEPPYRVPWLPRTGLEVERSSEVPR